MDWFTMIMAAISLAIRLVPVAEKAFDDKPDSGAEKKQMVLTGTKALIDTIGAVSTGGQAETWKKIEVPVSDAIDATCAVMFPHVEVAK
ncbi:MAG: hypothetical protein GY846_26395 [Deltaproteobacteria bacterium]|nr:hypothetical protein [Deltaproteobacteria bacterium]